MTVAIFGNAMKANMPQEVAHVLEFMQLRGVDICLSQELRQELNLREYPPFPEEWTLENGEWKPINGDSIDFALSIGGDGTFLTTAAAIGDKNIPIVGVNLGHLGFLAEVQTANVDIIMEQLIAGKYTIEQRSLLQVTCSEGGHISYPNALNEVAVLKQGLSSMIIVDTKLNGQDSISMEADGLVISTATGSTAYNLSVGGPMMVPQAKGMILSPVASHSLSLRPLVIPDDWKIDIKVRSRIGNYMLSIDGRSQVLADEVLLHVEKAPYTIKLVQVGENSFLNALKSKMSWGVN
ncbi:MAG: NAD(+)/NADH kinase [Paludibacteraceae bacterium]|nr:NAD(+)/NADH kinase [Paludibacteraceae bacterium]